MELDEYQRTVGRPDDFRRINDSRKQLQARVVDRNCVEKEYHEKSLKIEKMLADLDKTAAIYNKSFFCDKPILSEEMQRHEYILHVEILPQHIATIRVYKPKCSVYNHFSLYTTHKFKHLDLCKYNLCNYGKTLKNFDKVILSIRKELAEFIKTVIDIKKPSENCKDCKFKSMPIEICQMYECHYAYKNKKF
ncbi:hypothetical protein GQ473_05080 [archaeon]|nr:hypothetical protein [archaeon]